MGELLFTEDQWRAAARVEELTEEDYRRTPDRLENHKRIYGSAFVGGEYFVGRTFYDLGYGVQGPPQPAYTVYERRSYLVLCGPCESVAKAIGLARDRITLIPREYFQRMLTEAKDAHDEGVAEDEARAAIALARQQPKPRKITKRAKAVFEASEGKCHYCGTVLTLNGKWHIEHKFPRALFGGSEQENLVAACAPCNHAKRDKTDLEFIALRNGSAE